MAKRIPIYYAPHPDQKLFHKSTARFRVLACGRRWGKDRASVNEVIKQTVKLLEVRRPASLIPKVHVWLVSPTYPIASQVWREIKHFMPVELLARRPNETKLQLQLRGGGLIEVKSADRPWSLVGIGLDILMITEAALVKEQAWLESLRPALSSPGRAGMGIFNATPKGKNWFYRAYLLGQDSLEKDWESWNFPTSSNPYIDEAEIAEARRLLPERIFRQEYLAEFLEDAGAVFRGVMTVATGVVEEPKGQNVVIGVDWGKYEDFTVLTVLDVDRKRVIDLDRFGKLDYTFQLGRLANLVRKWRPVRKVVAESNAVGDPLVEQLKQDLPCQVTGFLTTSASKKRIVESLALAIERQEIVIPPIPELVNELQAYEYEMTRAGNVRYNAPSGYHDDCVMSLALAWSGVGSGIGFGDIPVAETEKSRWQI